MTIPDGEGVLRADPPLAEDVREYEKAVREAAASGQLLTAIEIGRDGLRRYPDNTLLRQQLALALVQTGALDAARVVLAELHQEAPRDEETLSLLGRAYKELWRRTRDPAAATEALRASAKWYGAAFDIKWSYYPGINLAFTLLGLGEREKAREVAARVVKSCRAELGEPGADANGWLHATLAEGLVHLGKIDEAATHYRAAAKAFAGRWRDLASMQRQAREILKLIKSATGVAGPTKTGALTSLTRSVRSVVLREKVPDQAWLDACFDFPSVVLFAGHMIDAPDRPSPRFPASREKEVREAIRARLEELRAGIGYSSAASGADILFCECMLERGGRINLVLPTTVQAFKAQSVAPAGPGWEERFHKVLSEAGSVLFANSSEVAPGDDPATGRALLYSSQIVTGLGAMEARNLDLELHALAVWDGNPGDGPGGTGSVVEEWRRNKIEPHIIPVSGVRDSASKPAGAGSAAARTPAAGAAPISQQIKAIAYAELLNYRKITERQMTSFVESFKSDLAKLVSSLPAAPVVAEAWAGDHHFIFDDVEDAALLALGLRNLVTGADWAARNLPPDLGIRVVLHAGPVFAFTDPVTNRPAIIGSHAMRTQRIRAITPPGEIYASQEFAALCAAEGISTIRFEFLGRVPTTKLFEDAPLYRLDAPAAPTL